jgi:hypothetical protein
LLDEVGAVEVEGVEEVSAGCEVDWEGAESWAAAPLVVLTTLERERLWSDMCSTWIGDRKGAEGRAGSGLEVSSKLSCDENVVTCGSTRMDPGPRLGFPPSRSLGEHGLQVLEIRIGLDFNAS